MSEFTKGEWEIRPTESTNENIKPLYYDIVADGNMFASTHKNREIDIIIEPVKIWNIMTYNSLRFMSTIL